VGSDYDRFLTTAGRRGEKSEKRKTSLHREVNISKKTGGRQGGTRPSRGDERVKASSRDRPERIV